MICPDCDTEVDELDWAPEVQGSGAQPGVCKECAGYYQNCEDLLEEEFESSLRDNTIELDFENPEDVDS